jgi:hypothetical protein
MYQQQGYRDENNVWHQPPDDTRVRFQPILQEFEAYLESSLPDPFRDSAASLEPHSYTHGPGGRAGMYEAVAYVVNLFADATRFADGATTWGTIGQWAMAAKRYWNARLQSSRNMGTNVYERDQLIFSATAVRAVCALHAMTAYHLSDDIQITMYSRHFDGGCADLPSGGELYNVHVTDGSDTYVYIVTGRISPRDHFRVGSDGIHPLALPDFSDFVSDPSSGTGRYTALAFGHAGSTTIEN